MLSQQLAVVLLDASGPILCPQDYLWNWSFREYSKEGFCVSVKDGNIGDQDRHQRNQWRAALGSSSQLHLGPGRVGYAWRVPICGSMSSTTLSSSAPFSRHFPSLLWQGVNAVPVLLSLWKRWTVFGRRSSFKRWRDSALYTVAAPAQCLAHSRCSANTCWIKGGMKGWNPALGIETEEVSGDWHAMSRRVGSRACKELWSAGGPDGPAANMLEGQLLGVLKLLWVPSWKSPSLAPQPDR